MSTETIQRTHLIHDYFVENTGIKEVFEVLFKSYLVSDDHLKLSPRDDADLIAAVRTAMERAFPQPLSAIAPNHDELRHNAYWRLFGYIIKGKESFFPKSSSYNIEFNKTLEAIFYRIAEGILDKRKTAEKVANPEALAILLNDLKEQLLSHTYNEIEDIASYWFTAFQMLRQLLRNDKLMKERLGIRAGEEYRRLIELGEKLKVPVAKETAYLFQLATQMHVFLRDYVEATSWNITNAADLYTTPQNETFFIGVFNAWFMVTGKDFLVENTRVRKRT